MVENFTFSRLANWIMLKCDQTRLSELFHKIFARNWDDSLIWRALESGGSQHSNAHPTTPRSPLVDDKTWSKVRRKFLIFKALGWILAKKSKNGQFRLSELFQKERREIKLTPSFDVRWKAEGLSIRMHTQLGADHLWLMINLGRKSVGNFSF